VLGFETDSRRIAFEVEGAVAMELGVPEVGEVVQSAGIVPYIDLQGS
jgi:hypothetical protein